MSGRVPVHTRDRRFQAAVAELAPRAVPSEERAGAVCVVSGRGAWGEACAAAIDAGAIAVVIADPAPAPREAYTRLEAAGVPVIASRPRLRDDLVADARADPVTAHLLVADAFSPAGAVHSVVRDAGGWLRALGGALPTVSEVARTPRALVAALEVGDVPASLTLAIGGAGSIPTLDVLALAPRRVEVRLDDAAGTREVSATDARGRLVRPERYETTERLALRRALDAVAGAPVADLADLGADDLLAAAILAAPRP